MKKPTDWKQIGLISGAVVVIGGCGAYWLMHRAPPPRYIYASVSRGDVATSITASGSVNPVVTVQVGSQVSGSIQALTCDYNTRVRKGQLCAKIDPKSYAVVVEQAQADLTAARAQIVKDQANVVYTKIAHSRADRLLAEDSGSHDVADIARNSYDQAVAQVRLDAAAIQQKAAVLKAAQVNLNYTNIVSPVDGTVVSRNVNVGQTVASSFTTPTLFLIATDLTKMQVDTNVSESDIAGAVEGADASFTVDGFPGQTFSGKVTQVRQAPISVQNVITYDAVITVGNPKLLLKPGMTATARIIRAQSRNVLRVPSQALRFAPSTAVATAGEHTQHQVWLLREGKLVSVPVTVGLDDDTNAEITAGDLRVGDQVATGQAAAGKAARSKSNATPALKL